MTNVVASSERLTKRYPQCYSEPDFFPARWSVASAIVPGRVFF